MTSHTHGRISPHDLDHSSSELNEDVELDLFTEEASDDENGNTQGNDIEDNLGIGSLFADLPSNVDATRALHGGTTSRRSLRRRQSAGIRRASDVHELKLEDAESLVKDAEDGGEKDIARAIAAPMAHKKSVRRIQVLRKESQRNIQRKLSYWKTVKLIIAMRWSLFKNGARDFFLSLQLWRGAMKEVEGNYGNGVLSYFLFLKSLFMLNILIFLILFCFLVVPQVIINYGHLVDVISFNTTTNTPTCPVADKNFYKNRTETEHILDFFTGQGWINTTLLFYSNYHGKIVVDSAGYEYDMPLAYMLVGGAYFIISLLIMVKNLATGFTESIIDSGGFFYSYCNKVFASWDYCITSEKAVALKCNCIRKDFIGELAEEERLERMKNRTRLDKFRIYMIRLGITIIVMGSLAASIYAIIKSVEVSTDSTLSTQNNSFTVTMKRWASSLTISVLNVVLPLFFEILTSFEDWSPRVEVAMALWRAVLLKLSSVAVLVIVLFSTYDDVKLCGQCWENQIASQMFNLIIIDFFVIVFLTIVVETGRKFVYRFISCGCDIGHKIGMQEFQIPKNVLDLVYGQALIWIGSFFAPMLPVLGIIKLFILFYVKKISLMYNCKPSSTTYQGARSNYFFTLLLLLTFLLCTVAVGWGITKLPTSKCGPYCNTICDPDHEMIDIIGLTIDKFPTWIRDTVDFVKTSVFIFPLFIIIFLLLYYYHAMTKAHEKMITMLKDHLIMEGRDKRFLMDRLVKASEAKRAGMVTPSRTITTMPGVTS